MANFAIEEFKTLCRQRVQTVSVVTTQNHKEELCGVTIGSAASFGINPPSISFSLNLNSKTHKAICDTGYFVLNNLNSSQQQIATQFASSIDNRFQDITLAYPEEKCPIIEGCLSALSLKLAALYEYNDHVIVIGIVEKIFTAEQLACNIHTPLTYYMNGYNKSNAP